MDKEITLARVCKDKELFPKWRIRKKSGETFRRHEVSLKAKSPGNRCEHKEKGVLEKVH